MGAWEIIQIVSNVLLILIENPLPIANVLSNTSKIKFRKYAQVPKKKYTLSFELCFNIIKNKLLYYFFYTRLKIFFFFIKKMIYFRISSPGSKLKLTSLLYCQR